MTSAIKGNENAMYPTDDWIKFYFVQPLVATLGEIYLYAMSGAALLLGQLAIFVIPGAVCGIFNKIAWRQLST